MTSKTWTNIKKYIPPFLSRSIKKIFIDIYFKFYPEGYFKKFSYLGEDFFIKVNPKNGTVDNVILFDGVLDPDHLSLMKEKMKDSDNFLDIGANIGQYSLFASKILKKGKVFAFEPIKDIFNQFESSIERNKMKNINAFNLACGNKDDVLEIKKIKGNAGESTFLNVDIIENKYNDILVEEVKVVKLDEFLKDEKVDFVKIDVEGFEYEVLLGMQGIIKNYKPKILIEFSPILYKSHKEDNASLIINLLLFFKYNIVDISYNRSVNDDRYAVENNIDMCYLFCE